MSKYIAFSTYCKEHNLSIPKDFNIEKDLLPLIPATDYKVAGYKFAEEALSYAVKELGLKQKKEVTREPVTQFVFRYSYKDKSLIVFLLERESKLELALKNLEEILDLNGGKQVCRLENNIQKDLDNLTKSIGLYTELNELLSDNFKEKKMKALVFDKSGFIEALIKDLTNKSLNCQK